MFPAFRLNIVIRPKLERTIDFKAFLTSVFYTVHLQSSSNFFHFIQSFSPRKKNFVTMATPQHTILRSQRLGKKKKKKSDLYLKGTLRGGAGVHQSSVPFGSWETGGDQYRAAPTEKTISPSQGSGSRGQESCEEIAGSLSGERIRGGGGRALRKGAGQVGQGGGDANTTEKRLPR